MGTFAAALSGAVNGDVSYRQVMQKGDFGLGTFNGITGELVAYDGRFYQISEQGKTVKVDPGWLTPYVQVIFFHPQIEKMIISATDYDSLKKELSMLLFNRSIPYAIHISGTFDRLKMRGRCPRKSGMKAQQEPVYVREALEGDLVGYYFLEHLLSLTTPGYHLHFLSADKENSGHLMDLSFTSPVTVELQSIQDIDFHIPNSEDYISANIPAPTLETYQKSQSQ